MAKTRDGLTLLLLSVCSTAQVSAHMPRFALEKFDLSDLRVSMVVAVDRKEGYFAYIADPRGYIYHVEVGEIIGKHFGRVTSISKCRLDILETRRDGHGGWKEAHASLELADCK
jgi:type IV pilus assembly protein PilP